ncbi:MAG: DUF3619 family protein [Burkholderiaceae bacterium]|nr:DUF3619 family protein [Burkholderiaceae bacterium]
MNHLPPSALAQRSAEAAQARFALRLTAALNELQSKTADADIDTRLRFAHDQALAAARKEHSTAAAALSVMGVSGGAAVLGGGPESGTTPWWLRLGSLLPLAVLLAGLVLIDNQYARSQIEAAAEVDAAILTDDLPPEAYRDQGFAEFLKTARP